MNNNIVQFFANLAAIDSPSGQEGLISNWIFAFLIKLGLKPVRDKYQMIYCRIGRGPNPILLTAHMDTVEPGRGIKVVEKNGYLCSEGETILGGDNKIPLAAILFSLEELLRKKQSINLELLFTVREETDSGIRQMVFPLVSKLGFLFDHSDGQLGTVVTRAPTISDFKIEFRGKGAHASLPEKGRDALKYLFSLGNALPLGRVDQETTFNIGLIEGGSATNTVPEQLSLQGDLRSTSLASFAAAKNLIEQIMISGRGVKVKLDWQPYAYGYQIEENDPDLVSLIRFFRDEGILLKSVSTTGGSDAGYLNHLGIKTFCMGDALIFTHTTKEQVKVTDLKKLQRLIASLMLRYSC